MKKLHKSLFLFLGILIIVVGFLAGCGSDKKSEQTKVPETSGTFSAFEPASQQNPNLTASSTKEDRIQQKIEQTEQLIIDISKSMAPLLKSYCNADGYVEDADAEEYINTIFSYVSDLKTQGKLTYCEKNDSNVYIRTPEGFGHVFMLPTKDVLSAGNSLQISTCNVDGLLEQNDIPNLFEGTVSASYTDYTVPSPDGAEQIERIKQLTSDDLLIWFGHGGYLESVGPCLSSGTVESWSQYFPLYDDRITNRIITGSIPEEGSGRRFYLLTPDFFRTYLSPNALKDSIVYLGSCYSCYDSRLADAFLEKGAKTVLGFSDVTYEAYGRAMLLSLTYLTGIEHDEQIDSYYCPTVAEVVSIAQDFYGDKDSNLDQSGDTHESSLILYGDPNAQLIPSRRATFKIMTESRHSLAADLQFKFGYSGSNAFLLEDYRNGDFSINIPAQYYEVTISHEGFETVTIPVSLDIDETPYYEIVLHPSVAQYFGGGSGTAEDPYLITAADHLYNMQSLSVTGYDFNGVHIAMANDIYLGDTADWELWGEYTDIGNFNGISFFKGVFDGRGHSIYGMRIMHSSNTDNFTGLFSQTKNAVIKNLNIRESVISLDEADALHAGAFIGHAINTRIENCHFYGNIYGIFVGSIVGSSSNSHIISCSNHGRVGGYILIPEKAAGICAISSDTTFVDCHNYGKIRGIQASEMTTMADGTCSFENCSNSGEIDSISYPDSTTNFDNHLSSGTTTEIPETETASEETADTDETNESDEETEESDEKEETTEAVKDTLTLSTSKNNYKVKKGERVTVYVHAVINEEETSWQDVLRSCLNASVSCNSQIATKDLVLGGYLYDESGQIILWMETHETGTTDVTLTIQGASVTFTITVEP